MIQPNPIGLAIVLPVAIFACGFVAGIYVAIRFMMPRTRAHNVEGFEPREDIRPSGIERYWMENGEST